MLGHLTVRLRCITSFRTALTGGVPCARVLQGIYPTGIIVLVCLNMTFHDDVTRATKLVSTMQCEPGRADVTTGIQSHPAVLNLRTGKDDAHWQG